VNYSTTEDYTDFEVHAQQLSYQEAIRLLQTIPAAQLASR
jgi:hypothetical protein